MVRARDAQRDRLARPGDPPPTAFWDGRAERFARFSRRLDPSDPFLRFIAGRCRPSQTLLDVGAGAGRFALPLARRVSRVTAVDPSKAMLDRLAAGAAEEGIANLSLVQARWEDAIVGPADLVICAHVVYPIREIDPFLRKLDTHARSLAAVYVRVGQVDDYVAEAWQTVWGVARFPHPDYRLLGEVLTALEIPARLELVDFENHVTYAGQQEAQADLAGRLGVRPDTDQEARLLAHLDRMLVPAGDGVGFAPRAVQGAIFWWTRA